MTDEEYIRKAVELADGWEWQEITDTLADVVFPWYDGANRLFTGHLLAQNQLLMDALAAQLVRQVGDWFDSLTDTAAITRVKPISFASQWLGGDSLGTIKAIVDSGVLEEDRE